MRALIDLVARAAEAVPYVVGVTIFFSMCFTSVCFFAGGGGGGGGGGALKKVSDSAGGVISST